MATKNSQRIVIWVITIVMAIGSLGAYFVIILQNNNQQADASKTAQQQNQPQEEAKVDPTAHKVDGKVTELQKEDLVVGTGAEVKAGESVKVNYKGTIAQTGVKFDSSYDRGQPATLPLSGVIKGWGEGIPGMKIGGKRRLIIPAALAYGDQSPSPAIPANSDLIFEVELLDIVPAQ